MSDKRPFWFHHIEAWQQSGVSQAKMPVNTNCPSQRLVITGNAI
ncbi:MAG: hypothetical protein ACR2PX_28600 [Endozoicomonas sp.]